MWYCIIYFAVVIIGFTIIDRYAEDHPDFSDSGIDPEDYSDQEALQGACIVWPLSIAIVVIVYTCSGIYKVFYYVVDKIYTKIVSCLRRREEKTN